MIASREANLYEINILKVYKADATSLVQSPMGDCVLEFWH